MQGGSSRNARVPNTSLVHLMLDAHAIHHGCHYRRKSDAHRPTGLCPSITLTRPRTKGRPSARSPPTACARTRRIARRQQVCPVMAAPVVEDAGAVKVAALGAATRSRVQDGQHADGDVSKQRHRRPDLLHHPPKPPVLGRCRIKHTRARRAGAARNDGHALDALGVEAPRELVGEEDVVQLGLAVRSGR